MRINNLEFKQCSYFGKIPEHIGWEICKWEPNDYYQQEDKFIKDGEWLYPKDDKYKFVKIHEGCFKNPEICYQIASWEWCKDEYIFQFCGNRPLDLNDLEWEDFKQLIKYGFKQLKI